ncbi:MAG: hypothetical protein F4206_13235, partial [Gammaproteobacteria bacterium]|nr:hypothetical protein [Gammaproteobacteria bacterium]MYG67674.1 hypothetical protein [Gammaproteobacteria bacterium]
MEILFVVPFALFWGILQEGKLLARIHFPDDMEPSRIVHVPRDDSWTVDFERIDLLLTPHRRKDDDPEDAARGAFRGFRTGGSQHPTYDSVSLDHSHG